MWSPTADTNKIESDNNKEKEAVEEACTCAADEPQQQPQQQQQQLNVFKSNSKKEDKEAAYKKEKELGIYAAETIDSGFISGPQTSNIFSEPIEIENNKPQDLSSDGAVGGVKFNIPATPPTAQNKKLAENIVLDSGCIDDEDFAEEENDDNDDDDVENEDEATSITSDEEKRKAYSDEQQQQNQVQRELSSPAVATTLEANAATANEQMILKHNVDAGMSEWFCNLSLQSDAVPLRPQLQQNQQQQQTAAEISMNNLDAAERRIAANSLNQSHKQAAGNTATATTPTTTATAATTTTTTATTSNLTPLNAWEQFYQQNDDGDTPLHLACISGYVDVVAALIRMAPHPCLFNIQNDEAQTPLHLAALTSQPKILRMLLIAGAEPTLRDRHGNTALHLSCISGEEQCVRALIIPISASEINEAHRLYGHRSNDKMVSYLSCARLPSDLEIRNYDGERCVHLASQAGHIDILRILVLYGADINAREGKSGRTPLHIAIECCNEDLANFLLDDCQKLNLEAATYAGLTAYQVACILNKSQMQNILEKRGAEPLTPPDSDYDSDIETDLDDSKLYDRFGDPGYFIGYNGGNPMTVA